jgi:hypothetical protein
VGFEMEAAAEEVGQRGWREGGEGGGEGRGMGWGMGWGGVETPHKKHFFYCKRC